MLSGFQLSTAIWLPIVAGVAVLFTGSDRNAYVARWLALAGAVGDLAVALPLYAGFDPGAAGMQFVELLPWIEAYNGNYHLGIYGISLLMILLNCFTTVLVELAGWPVAGKRVRQVTGALLRRPGVKRCGLYPR